MFWWSIAAAQVALPVDLPDQPLLVWAQEQGDVTEIRALPLMGREVPDRPPWLIASHDGPLRPGPRLTEDIVWLWADAQRWWVDVATGTVTPHGAILERGSYVGVSP